MSDRSALLLLSAFLVAKSIIIIWFIVTGPVGLGPDEAQYWTWSQQIDWGYYSKPPGVAWQIGLGTKLFGNTVLGVRFGSVIIGSLLSFAIYFLARSCRLQPKTSLAAAIAFAASPLGMASSFLAITDVGLVLFWTLALALFCRDLDQQRHSYYSIGLAVMLGALFKWPIYLFWPLAIGWLLLQRKPLTLSLLGGIAISLFGLLPSVIWNSHHDWPTFKHVSATIYNRSIEEGSTNLLRGNFWEFIGAQAILVSPVLFILLLLSAIALFKNWRHLGSGLKFCSVSSLLIITIYALGSITKKMQGNWCDYAYPGAFVLLTWYSLEYAPKAVKWFWGGIAFSLLLVSGLLSVPILQSRNLAPFGKIAYKSNPFKHNLGWEQIAGALEQAGYDPSRHFLFSDRYQNVSILSFYGPQQQRAYFLNLQGIRKNQFSYWSGMDQERVGSTGFFVAIENDTHSQPTKEQELQQLNPFFQQTEYVGSYPLFFSYGKPVKYAKIYRGINYNGKTPSSTELY